MKHSNLFSRNRNLFLLCIDWYSWFHKTNRKFDHNCENRKILNKLNSYKKFYFQADPNWSLVEPSAKYLQIICMSTEGIPKQIIIKGNLCSWNFFNLLYSPTTFLELVLYATVRHQNRFKMNIAFYDIQGRICYFILVEKWIHKIFF